MGLSLQPLIRKHSYLDHGSLRGSASMPWGLAPKFMPRSEAGGQNLRHLCLDCWKDHWTQVSDRCPLDYLFFVSLVFVLRETVCSYWTRENGSSTCLSDTIFCMTKIPYFKKHSRKTKANGQAHVKSVVRLPQHTLFWFNDEKRSFTRTEQLLCVYEPQQNLGWGCCSVKQV